MRVDEVLKVHGVGNGQKYFKMDDVTFSHYKNLAKPTLVDTISATSPAKILFDNEGYFYITNSYTIIKKNVETNEQLWSNTSASSGGSNYISSMVIDKIGNIYATCGNTLIKINTNGIVEWSINYSKSPEIKWIDNEGNIYVVVYYTQLIKIAPDKTTLWNKPSIAFVSLTIPEVDNKSLYLIHSDHSISKYDLEGNIISSYTDEYEFSGYPDYRVVYLRKEYKIIRQITDSYNSTFRKVDYNNNIIWEVPYPTTNSIIHNALDEHDIIYTSLFQSPFTLTARDSNANIIWEISDNTANAYSNYLNIDYLHGRIYQTKSSLSRYLIYTITGDRLYKLK